MRRFFTEPENISGTEATIFEDAEHISKVLRMNEGDEIIIFDGSGYEYISKLTQIDKAFCKAEIITKSFSEQEPAVSVTIYQGIPKSGKMEDIIQKSVELGAVSIIPVSMDRCVSKIESGKKEAEKIKRWNKVAVSAAKQCGRGIIPTVEPPLTFKQAIEKLRETELAIMPYEVLGHNGEAGLKTALKKYKAKEIGVIIGPEGGFSDSEAKLAMDSGIVTVGLGKRILRTETVSSAIISAIMYEKDET